MSKKKRKNGLRFPPRRVTWTPADIETVNRMYLQGYDPDDIAAAVNVDRARVIKLCREKLRPMWQEQMKADAELELAKIFNLERNAWAAYNTEDSPNYGNWQLFGHIRWCIAFRSKLHRNYEQQFRETDAELRVGGAANREQVEMEMAMHLLELANQALLDKAEKEAAARPARKSRKKKPADGENNEPT